MALLDISGAELLLWRRKLLSKGGRKVDIDWLLDIGGGVRWSQLQQIHLDPKRSLKLEEPLEYLEKLWCSHLEDQIPLQYLVGKCPWRDFELEISPAALIPRQETELLVDLALSKFDSDFLGLWADLGTGSGAIAVALGRSLPRSIGHAVDFSQDALSLAQRNLQQLSPIAQVSLHCGNWWEPLKPWWGSFGFALANPPYIPASLIDGLDPIIIRNEPYIALSGGADGLDAIREIVSGAFNAIRNEGWLFLEHHHDQSDDVLELMSQSGFQDVDFETDLQGIRRFALGRHQ
ncbi:HemK/PrmC family methyltransferase [Prochlorococcus sp. MIT 1307]|uniref:HemK/PrmC family methyltransferase n=1 Tax=Prochlorococcus sp. MIT 1307 TaxID=3096219 RepID=UPI002A75E208|nr:HemK/PrmC family methyltransferase [Prochlorococcus sp. MIT 1307]